MTPLQEDIEHATPDAIANNRPLVDRALAAESGYHFEFRDGAIVRVKHDPVTLANLE